MSSLRKTAAVLANIPSWVTLEIQEGQNNGESDVTVQPYTGRTQRTATIKATTAGGASDSSQVVQEGKIEHITINTTSYNISNNGGTVEITGTSNSPTLSVVPTTSISGVTQKIEINEIEDDSWNGDDDVTIDGDPGSSAEYSFKIIFTIPANTTSSSRNHIFRVTNGSSVQSNQITITQSAGVKTYSIPIITSFTYPDIPASGDTVIPVVQYTQTWGWNGSTTGGGTETSGGTLEFSGSNVDTLTGEVSANTLGTTVKARSVITTASVKVILNGQESEVSNAQVYQAANTATYGNVTINGGSVTDIPASGGSVSSATGIDASQTIVYTSGSSRNGEVSINYSAAVSASSLGTTVKSRTKIGELTVTATGEGSKSNTKVFDVYQAANTATYQNPTLDLTTPVSIQAAGGTYDLGAQVDSHFSQIVSFTSGATRDGEITLEEYEADNTVDGFSINTETGVITITKNPGVTARNGYTINVTITGEGSKSVFKQVVFNQQGSASYIEVIPETLEFDYTGGTKTITISSNDSWTIS